MDHVGDSIVCHHVSDVNAAEAICESTADCGGFNVYYGAGTLYSCLKYASALGSSSQPNSVGVPASGVYAASVDFGSSCMGIYTTCESRG